LSWKLFNQCRPWLGLALAGLALGLGLGSAGPARADQDRVEILVGGHPVQVELALTRQEKMRGLSGRPGLGPDQGLLFVYQDPKNRTFWMKGMKFAIDLIWLADRRVIGVETNLQPPGRGQRPQVVASPRAVDMVLEVPAGWTARHLIGPGARLTLPQTFLPKK